MLRRTLIAGAMVRALAATGPSSLQAKSLDEILSDGVIRIGINPNFPNMSTRNDAGAAEANLFPPRRSHGRNH